MGKSMIITVYEAFKAFSITIFIFCGILTLIVLFYFWLVNGSYKALVAVTFGVTGFYYFIKLINDLKQIQKKAVE